MRRSVYKHTISIVFLFVVVCTYGQKRFDLSLQETSLKLDGKSLTGYSSQFDFTRDEVRRGWWKYARQFGSPLDMRTYYQIKIPSETNDGNVDLMIYSETLEEGGNTFFRIGIEDKKYKVQVEELLKVFKKDMYIQHYLSALKVQQLEAEKYASQYETAMMEEEKVAALDSLTVCKQEMERLKEEIRKIDL